LVPRPPRSSHTGGEGPGRGPGVGAAVARDERLFDTGRVVVPAELRPVADRARPVTLARERTRPLLEPLLPLLPDAGLARGTSMAVTGTGATTLALGLAAGPSRAGSWVAVVGLAELGLAAAAEAGVDLRRLALVDGPPPGQWAGVVAALVG